MSTLMEVKDELGRNSRSTASGSSMAPTDFHLSQSLEGSAHAGTISVALERCVLCGNSRRSFYCRDCVVDGDFFHSRNIQSFQGLNRPATRESYAEKLKKWKSLKDERECIVERFRSELAAKLKIDEKRTEIYMSQLRVAAMKTILENMAEEVSVGQQHVDRLINRTQSIQHKAENHLVERSKFLAYLSKLSASVEHHVKMYEGCLEELMRLRKQHISDLVSYIFPITELQTKSDNQPMPIEDIQQSTVSLLADARRTAYIKGRWVLNDSGYEQLYRIVMPTLPGSGDYSLAMMDKKDISYIKTSDDVDLALLSNPSHTVKAALALTTQLVSHIASYLDVILPRRLHFSEFSYSELSEQRFNQLVLRLNQNVLCLCFTHGGVELRTLQPHNTLGNILAVVNSPDLRKFYRFDMVDDETADIMVTMESNLFEAHLLADDEVTNSSCVNAGDDSDSNSLDDADGLAFTCDVAAGMPGGIVRDDYRSTDWEHVPITLPEAEMMSTSPSRNALPGYFTESHSNVTSLVSSAASSVASSVASLWRGWGRTATIDKS